MTALELIAVNEAERMHASARRSHERLAIVEARAGHPLTARKHADAAKRLQRYAPSEVLIVREIG